MVRDQRERTRGEKGGSVIIEAFHEVKREARAEAEAGTDEQETEQ